MLREWITAFRVLGYLKRLTIAAESLAESQETLARIETDRWQQANMPRPKGKFVIGSLDVKAANELWHRQQEAERTGTEP
jgi:hypothetical protein